MITNLIRTAIAPSIETILNEERTRLNDIINDLEHVLDDVKSIRASDIADNISTYDIAADISIDAYDIAREISIDASDIDIDYRNLAERIASEIGGDIDINYSELARDIADNIDLNEVNARINNVHTNLQTVERKMDLILKHLGITPENA